MLKYLGLETDTSKFTDLFDPGWLEGGPPTPWDRVRAEGGPLNSSLLTNEASNTEEFSMLLLCGDKMASRDSGRGCISSS